ncbi:EF-hand domain-containing protein [Actinomadura sp. 1N219]|uniref:EF-hand domain-containing protein n=1 Tax=Actinomadura sp. 1N219 TaxID=3375152 RepID=UPI003793F9E7
MEGVRELKYRRWFHALDIDNDGAITRQDAHLLAERLTGLTNPRRPSQAQRLSEAAANAWDRVIGRFDHNFDSRVEEEEMVATLRQTLTTRDSYSQQLQPIIDAYFDLVDTDRDGAIGPDDYARVYQAATHNRAEDGAEIFDYLDLEGRGTVSREQFHRAFTEFFYSDNPNARANNLLGRLPA